MVAAISTHFDKRSYPVVDAADKESCRPDFAIACYPGHLWNEDKGFMPEEQFYTVGTAPGARTSVQRHDSFIAVMNPSGIVGKIEESPVGK